MAGILDKKQRFIDTEITAEGRRQIAAGELSIKYASFTDGHTFYVSGANSAAESAQERLYFEATSRLQDQIIVETDGDQITHEINESSSFFGPVIIKIEST